MKRIFVAGPYGADNVLGVLKNIREGIRVAESLFAAGYAPFCPWLDHQYEFFGDHPTEDYYRCSRAWLDVSDAVFLVKGWEKSEGTKREIERAKELGIPIFETWYELLNWRVR